jgi:hypothetical protein
MLTEVDADLLLQDFGSSVIAGAVSGLGILDRKSEILLNDRIITVEYSVIVRTDQFGDLQYGGTVIVGGQAYEVMHEPIRIADGIYSVLILDRIDAAQSVITTLSGLRLVTLDGRLITTL